MEKQMLGNWIWLNLSPPLSWKRMILHRPELFVWVPLINLNKLWRVPLVSYSIRMYQRSGKIVKSFSEQFFSAFELRICCNCWNTSGPLQLVWLSSTVSLVHLRLSGSRSFWMARNSIQAAIGSRKAPKQIIRSSFRSAQYCQIVKNSKIPTYPTEFHWQNSRFTKIYSKSNPTTAECRMPWAA